MADENEGSNRINRRFNGGSGLVKGGVGCGIIVLGIGLLLFIVLFPMSFSYLDFFEVN